VLPIAVPISRLLLHPLVPSLSEVLIRKAGRSAPILMTYSPWAGVAASHARSQPRRSAFTSQQPRLDRCGQIFILAAPYLQYELL
jgi:hypothetical protein